jgi:transposase
MAQLMGNERVDDIPLLLNQIKKVNLIELVDKHFQSHGNWQGISIGKVVAGWLSYIVSEGDHRLNQVEPWAESIQETLKINLDPEVERLDFSDDHLGRVLDQLSKDEEWDGFEGELTGHTVRVYALRPSRVHLDSTTAMGHRGVTAEGLFQFGHSKDYRPDLPQIKISQSALDPLGMPVSTTVVSGNRADDPTYVPEIKKVQQYVQATGLLYVGDSKMSALATRCYVAQSDNHYLCPLPEVQVSKKDLAELLAPVLRGEIRLGQVSSPKVNLIEDSESSESLSESPSPDWIAEGFSVMKEQTCRPESGANTWQEKWWVVHSFKQGERQQRNLDQRIEKATAALVALNESGRGHKRLSVDETIAAARQILKRYKVESLLQVDYDETTQTIHKRAYGDSPARTISETSVTVKPCLDSEAYKQTAALMGWRVYATNDLDLSLQEAVYGYRNEYLIERCFGRYKGKSLGLTPIYLASDDRVKGLIRLLSLGLRILCLLEFSVRSALEPDQQQLPGLYAGNPKRATARPTAELLLRAFRGITLTIMEINGVIQRFLSPLSELQQRILRLLGCSDEIYLALTG